MLTIAVIFSALHGVFVAAVYRHATAGDTPDGFEESALEGAFRPK